jgi:hypothetical protein
MPRAANTKQDSSKAIAWVVSIGVHLGLGLIAFFITWSVMRSDDSPPPLITATWHEQPAGESSELPLLLPPTPDVALQMPKLPQVPKRAESVTNGIAVLNHVAAGSPLPVLARREQESEVKFMGLDAVAAKRIVYVVDASGSMLLYLSSVLQELERSLATLHPKQEFNIIFFQQNKAITVPPIKSLRPATADNIKSAMRWIRTSGQVIPTGSSNPITAIRTALRLKPDVIYLLSENITGSGRYEVPPDELITQLDKLNPIDRRNDRRRVQINCIQYLTPDPLGTMERIADIHGGVDGYTFIERGRVGW